MELDLVRHDYTQVGSLKYNTLRLLKSAKGKSDKLVVGDDTGLVTCFSIKKGELQEVFKVEPGDSDRPVGCIALSGKEGDRIFVARGQSIKGITKKGKEFFAFQPNLTEDITSMFVLNKEGKIYTGGEFLYNEFIDCKDSNYCMMNDKINHITLAPCGVGAPDVANAIVACNDRCVRVINDSQVAYEVPLEGAPTVLLNGEHEEPNSCMIFYGTDNGILGQLFLGKSGGYPGWTLTNVRKLGGITSLGCFDFTHDGSNDLVVGRDDGTVECITFDDEGPKLLFTSCVNECIMSVAAGNLSDISRDEVIVGTFSGKIVGFIGRPDGDMSVKEQTEANAQGEKRIKNLRGDLDKLHKDVNKKKEKYAKATNNQASTSQVKFNVHEKFMLDDGDAMYNLSLEIRTPIDFVMLQSDIELEILEVETNTAIVNRCKPSPEEGNVMVATYTCVENSNRLDLKIRMIEGKTGTLTAYVAPTTVPKVAQSCTFKIKPLSLHRRAHNPDLANHILSSVKVTGSFSLAEMHAWISSCLPEMPDRCTEDEISIVFESTFLETILACQYKKGEAHFQSDNICALAVLKEVISREATQRKTQVSVNTDIKEESLMSCLEMLHPKLEYQYTLAKHFKLIEPLKEISMQEANLDFLSPEYRSILERADTIQAEFKLHPKNLEYLNGIVTNLYVDKAKFKGSDARQEVPMLMQVLEKYDWDSLVAFFSHSR